MKTKIEIKHWITGSILFEFETNNNTIAKTLERAISERADLRYANLRSANLSSANLRSADLSYADLRGIAFENLPITYINLCSRDMLFIFEHLKAELPFLREKLIKGKVDGTQYAGECACLVGTLANANGGLEKVCSTIPFYDKGTHNPGEAWFLNIREGDTPKNNDFAKHALLLIDMILDKKKKK